LAASQQQDFYRTFSRTVKVLRDPEAKPQQEEGAAMSTVSSELISEAEGAGMSTPSGTEVAEQRKATETITPASADPGTLWKEPGLTKKGEIKEEGIETEPSPSKMKEEAGRKRKKKPPAL
jgi:hypothetical protein